MGLRSARDTNECPCCGTPGETTIHVLRCRAIKCRKQWRRGIKTVMKWMTKSKTDPDLQAALYTTLRRFNQDNSYDSYVDPSLPDGEIKECIIAQSHIGWTGLLEGLLSPKWALVQQRHFLRIGSRRSGTRWAIGLSKTLWQLVFTMWDHRNSILFAKGKIDELSGIAKVRTAISQERQIGLGQLDPSFHPYLQIQQSSFTKMKAIDLRRWLSLIRQACEETGYIYTDDISTSTALCDWIGLSKSPQSRHQHTAPHKKKQREKLRFIRTGYLD